MNLHKWTRLIFSCFLFLLCWMLLAIPVVYGVQFEEEVSTQDYLFAKGIIKSISIDEQTITLKQKEGPNISISIDKDTVFEGFYKLSELKIRQKMKIWYQPMEEENKALKILKPLELGC